MGASSRNYLYTEVRPSLVDVYFEDSGMRWTYYNDRFDLSVGDRVWVEGKLEGVLGEVVSVNYRFRIRLSDYKRVIGMADTEVEGKFHFAGNYFITFDRNALPSEKVRGWFIPPVNEEDIAVGDGEGNFSPLGTSFADPIIEERGRRYYEDGRVRYLCLDGINGYAIVEGSDAYEVEFEYRNGEIGDLFCSCYCNYSCKHQAATARMLSEMLGVIEAKGYADYSYGRYFAAVLKDVLFNVTLKKRESGSITL